MDSRARVGGVGTGRQGRRLLFLGAFVAATAVPLCARAQATLITGLGGAAGFGANVLATGDDNSSASINLIPFDLQGLCFFGAPHTTMFINNNGNITFNAIVSTYTPNPFPASTNPMMAPWWGDVDTRGAVASPTGSNRVYWDIRQISGLGQIVVTWYNVGYYNSATSKLNTFQLVIRETAAAVGATPAEYTVEYRYAQLQWTTGTASGGTNGLGGTPAQAGFDAGDSVHYSQLPGSRTASVLNLLNSSNTVPAETGVWRFSFHSCQLACTSNADCAGATPICDATSHTCRACSADADCSAPTAFCATSGANVGKCVQCNTGPQCSTGTCTGNACVCTSNANCPSGKPICDATAPRVCRACNPATAADCTGTTPVCGASGNCVACGPGFTTQCTSPNLSCNAGGTCVQCAPGSTAACTGATSFCDATTYTCRGCTIATQATDCSSAATPACNTATGLCVAAALALTSPAAGTTVSTTNRTPAFTGTGIPGQSVAVTAGGLAACSATVAAGGTWSCTSTITLAIGSSTIVASSAGLTSTATLNVQCTADAACGAGQVCNVGTGACVTPACRGNAGSGSTADCPAGTPVCTSPATSSAACGSCTGGMVYNTATFVCVTPAVALTAPPAGGNATTTNLQPTLAGTGVPGQTVVVTANGVMACMTVVTAAATWTCAATANVPLGSLTITATSAGATSSGTLFVACSLDGQCASGQACNVGTGSCATPVCRGNAGSGSTADCPAATPVCTNPGTATAACGGCGSGQVYNTATLACVAPAVALTYPPAGGSATTTVVRPTFAGTGVPGQSVTISASGLGVCTTAVGMAGTWSCVPMADLPVGTLTINATSAGVSSAGTLVVQCTGNTQCSGGQVCDVGGGACVTPACLGNSGSGSGGDCPGATPVCLNPDTSSASCSTCPTAQVYDGAAFACVTPAVAFTSPPAGATTNTTNLRAPLAGTGVPGQAVTVVAGGTMICSTTVATSGPMVGTWGCTPSADLALGSLTLLASSGGATSSAVLVVLCTLDGQCTTGQACNVTSGACATPSCLGNANAGSGRDCPAATPICAGPGTASAACAACASGRVYDATGLACVAPAVALTAPAAGASTDTSNLLFPIAGTGVSGQPVNVTANGAMVCVAVVAGDGTWTCTPMTALPLGMLTITASSGGASSSATLNVQCALDSQCLTGQVCNTTSGACVAPTCRGNAGSGSAADCAAATPICTAAGTASSGCTGCGPAQVYNTVTFACVAPAVALTSPPASGSAPTTALRPAITGTGVPGQAVAVTANGMSACMTTVASDGTWTCNPLLDLALGSQTIVATSGGVTSTGTFIVQCTLDNQCSSGQACDTVGGACVTPSCLGNTSSGSGGDCPAASPVCTAAGTATAACGTCAVGRVYNNATFACVAPAVALVSPAADSTTTTTDLRAPISGTGVPGQTVTVTDDGAALCAATVAAGGTWSCTPAANLPLGSNTIVATSAGVASSGVLVVACTIDGQCGAGRVCTVAAGACTTPNCRGNSGSGSTADCPADQPSCTGAGTSGASCGSCDANQVFNTATFACVSPAVALTFPPAGGTASSSNPLAPITGTGVPGQTVSVTVNGQAVCTTSVDLAGAWICSPSLALAVGPLLVNATSGGATSTGTLVVLCTGSIQCTAGQTCNTASGDCVTPSCRGNAGSGSAADCPASAPVCNDADMASALCGPCPSGRVYDTSAHACVSPAVSLVWPPAGASASTQDQQAAISGTGIPGQTVTVSVNGTTACNVTVEPDGTWSCIPLGNLPLGSNTVIANSAGSVSSATLVVQCAHDDQCETGQVCSSDTGACMTPQCIDNAGAGTTANCPSATPVCTNPGTAGASCGGCDAGLVYDTTAHACVAGAVALTFPPTNGTSTTKAAMPSFSGTGVPGQTVTLTSGTVTLCVTVVLEDGTWTCSSTVVLPTGSNLITADSAGATSSGTLVEQCALNVQCTSEAPVCDIPNGVCVGCVTDTACPSSKYCDLVAHSCSPTLPPGMPCTRDAECVAGSCTQGHCAGAADAGADGSTSNIGGGQDAGRLGALGGGGGCGCAAGGAPAPAGVLAGLSFVLLALAVRRRRGRSRHR